MMSNVTELSDKELREVLTQHGQSVGPITGTTRRVYELLLEQLLSKPSSSSKDKKKRRQTLDTAMLRSTQKPQVETRRRQSEQAKPKVPATLTLSDYSDTELPLLDTTPDNSPDPPQSLSFSSPTTTRRRTSSKIKPKSRGYDPTMFSDEDESNAKKKKKGAKPPPKTSCPMRYILGALFTILCCGGVGYYLLTSPPPAVSISPLCTPPPLDIPAMQCDKTYRKLAAQKLKLDLYSGQVLCEEKEGHLYRASPDDTVERNLLFAWREEFNYTVYIKKEDLYLSVESAAEITEITDSNGTFYYKTNTPYITLTCQIFTIVNNFAYYILISVIILAMAQLAHKVYGWKRNKAKQETGQMYELIDQIIEELQRNYSKYQTDPINYVPYVPIPHARDRLLLPSERSHMKHIWERAVAFIAQHESRVRVEMRRVQSEDFPVWYWLEASKPALPVQPDSTSSDFLYPNLDSDIQDQPDSEYLEKTST